MMFVVLSYDVETKRIPKVAKTAKKYLMPVQRSLYHGYITERQLEHLKMELGRYIDTEKDSIIFYKSHNNNTVIIDELGRVRAYNGGML